MAADPALVLAAVQTEADVQARLTRALSAILTAALRRFLAGDTRDPVRVRVWTNAAGRAVTQARRQASGVADAYMRRVLDLQDVPSRGPAARVAPEPRGIPLEQEWVRPVEEYRHARIVGLEQFEAEIRAERRAATIADLDMAMARRDAYAARLANAEKVTGWRRIIHPELSTGGTCGLCIAAADRTYSRGDLLPIHARCACTVLPIVKGQPDPGHTLDQESLRELYALSGGTGRQQLAKVRYAVREHGEIGPVLVDEGDAFMGPADLPQTA